MNPLAPDPVPLILFSLALFLPVGGPAARDRSRTGPAITATQPELLVRPRRGALRHIDMSVGMQGETSADTSCAAQ